MDKKTDFFLAILNRFGWLGNWLFFLIALTECIPIVGSIFPGGTLISIAAFFAAHGYFNVWDIFAFAIVGAIIGDYSGYSLGRWGSDWLVKKNLIKQETIDKGEDFFRRHGNKSIFWGRFIGATRAIVPFVAGTSKMKARSFFFWNSLSALGWAVYNVGLGYFSGNIIAIIIKKGSSRFFMLIGLALIALAAYWLIKKKGQSIWVFFVKKSEWFMEKIFSTRWFKRIESRYPVTDELLQSQISQEKVFASILGIAILIILYVLVIILDFF